MRKTDDWAGMEICRSKTIPTLFYFKWEINHIIADKIEKRWNKR